MTSILKIIFYFLVKLNWTEIFQFDFDYAFYPIKTTIELLSPFLENLIFCWKERYIILIGLYNIILKKSYIFKI